MELNGKRMLGHHLANLSGLSQAPLLANHNNIPDNTSGIITNNNTNNNGSARSTPVSLHSLNHGSPSKLFQQSVSTPVTTIKSQASIFFPATTNPIPNPNNNNNNSSANRLQTSTKQPPFSPSLHLKSPPSHAKSQRPVDVNMNSEQEFNREVSKRISPSSVSATHSFTGFFPPQPLVPRSPAPSITTNDNHNNKQVDLEKDEHYHLYHEPDEPPSPPLPQRPASSNFGARRPAAGYQDDVSESIYQCYVTLKSQRSAHRSRSYHGPKNSIDQGTGVLGLATNTNLNMSMRSHQLAMDSLGRNLGSTSVAELPLGSPTSPLATSPASMLPIHFRDHCVRELLETESNYVHALDMMITCFAKPLEPLLRREDNQLIFGHIKYFHQVHSAFQADLMKAAFRSFSKDLSSLPLSAKSDGRTSQPPTPTQFLTSTQQQQSSPLSSPSALTQQQTTSISLSACFLHAKDKFLKYGEYCATLSKAQELLDELTNKNEAIATQLDHCQQEANEGKFKLRDLLSLPMQRILKYHLLLAQLIKNTSPSNDDYHGLKRAHETMVDLGQYINEVKRDTEAIQIINEIEQSITGLNMPPNTQLTDYGRLVTDGFIRMKVPGDSNGNHGSGATSTLLKSKPLHDAKLKQKRYVFVFDKVMLMCKLSGVRGYQYKEAIVLSDYDLEVNPTSSATEQHGKLATKDKWSHQFNLVRQSDRTTYCLYAKNLEMKSKWVGFIQRAIDNTRPSVCRNSETNHEFLMHTFDKASSCDHCGKLLHGLYYQGYRCRICFTSAHKKCLGAIKPCGPTLQAKNSNHGATKLIPSSPSVRSNCSDDSRNAFMHFPNVSSTSTPCVDLMSKNEYSNIKSRGGENPAITSSFRENGTRGILTNQRPVSSMVNVSSLQNGGGQNCDPIESYVNFILNDHPWFCGSMERDRAQALLEKMPHGTFLVRVSPKHNGSYVISLNHNNQVKHMRIYVSKDNQLYLSQNRYFKSVIELVSWYEKNSLVESFHMLDARLLIPFKPQ